MIALISFVAILSWFAAFGGGWGGCVGISIIASGLCLNSMFNVCFKGFCMYLRTSSLFVCSFLFYLLPNGRVSVLILLFLLFVGNCYVYCSFYVQFYVGVFLFLFYFGFFTSWFYFSTFASSYGELIWRFVLCRCAQASSIYTGKPLTCFLLIQPSSCSVTLFGAFQRISLFSVVCFRLFKEGPDEPKICILNLNDCVFSFINN